MPQPQAVFMIGEQRSGSNLLRLILGSHSQIFAPHPPHILQRFLPLIEKYKHSNNDSLVDDVLKLVRLNPIPWGFLPDKISLKKDYQINDLFEVFYGLMNLCSLEANCNTWVCKSMQNVKWSERILKDKPNAKFIYLYRDPRDVAVSFKKAIVGEKHVYAIAKRWMNLQKACLSLQKQLPKSQFFSLSYYELVTETEEVIKRLTDFLGLNFESQMNDYYNQKEAKVCSESGRQWVNLAKPILKNNFNKYQNELSKLEIEIIESVCHTVMSQLGFDAETEEKQDFSSDEIAAFLRINEKLKRALKEKHVYKTERQAQQQAFLKQLQSNVS